MDKIKRIKEISHDLSEELKDGLYQSLVDELEISHSGLHKVILEYAMIKSLMIGIPYNMIELDMLLSAIIVLRLNKEEFVKRMEPSIN